MQIGAVIECYVRDARCSLFNWLLNGRPVSRGGALATYVGVAQGDEAFKPVALLTRSLLALVMGQQVQLVKEDCEKIAEKQKEQVLFHL